ncbi:hypothetical protein HID58_043145 [Brassica napus]|uniref:Uncharacterized protein n=1 Tax=Brassica napus TaxID=3708 RepID=A0ABQ8BFN9_BRANA|nr:hypothetical protein HID58_043145 [Brassica napus]
MASVLLLFLVFVFDLTAFGLAVAAEQRRTTVVEVINESGDSSYCVYEKDIATADAYHQVGLDPMLLFFSSPPGFFLLHSRGVFTCGICAKRLPHKVPCLLWEHCSSSCRSLRKGVFGGWSCVHKQGLSPSFTTCA